MTPVCKDPGTEISVFNLGMDDCTHDTASNTGVQSHNAINIMQITVIIINQKGHKKNKINIRCKYRYELGHTDFACPDKRQKRPPSMPT